MPRESLILLGIIAFWSVLPGDGSALAKDIPNLSDSPDGPVAPSYTECGGVPSPPVTNEAFEKELVELVNAERAKVSNGSLPPLKRVDPLDQAARYYSIDMGIDNYWPSDPLESHATYDREGENLIKQCNWIARVTSYYGSYASLRENIAAGQSTPQEVMNAWMNSPGHRNNILASDVWEIGVGYFEGSGNYYRYWTQDFGRKWGEYPLVINRESSETRIRRVFVYIYEFYETWQQMRLQNDGGAWSAWMPFQSEFGWTLPDTGGLHTICAELDNGGSTKTTCDSIYYQNFPGLDEQIYIPLISR